MLSFLAKCLLTAGLLSGSILSATAQIQVSTDELPTTSGTGRFKEDVLRKLKGTTTLFVLLDHDYEQIDAYQQAIGRVWKYTPFKIIRRSEIGNYLEEGKYSFGVFGGYIITVHNNTTIQLTYDLGMFNFNRQGEVKGMNYFSRMALSPNAKSMSAVATSAAPAIFGFSTKERRKESLDNIYAEGSFYDWSPGFLMGKLQFVNKLLTAGETIGSFDDLANKEALAGLRRDTLFIPNYVNTRYSIQGVEQEKEANEDDVKDVYPYKVQFVSTEELNNRIMNIDKPIYYLVSTVYSGNKYINVYHSKKGRLYAEYAPMSYKFKYKDLKKIAKLIKD
ncbi:MAG: hypothetical protein EOP52_05050 [Sphingobacteriales bacterium]|nr:MAG: hypothetical protein EOP52_05050 [Sphingobacteriales bacterium]